MNSKLSYLAIALTAFGVSAAEPQHAFVNADGIAVNQQIPGDVQCEFYDAGGKGVSFHDSDAINSGSGGLNKGSDYFSTFRINEPVDISYTKYENNTDNSEFNLVKRKEKQLYVGWTEAGEWMKYTVDVKQAGTYKIGLMFTAHDGGVVRIASEDGKQSDLTIPSTFDANDPLNWRQWHHWNYIDDLGSIELKKGKQVITLTTLEKGQMNYDFLRFTLM